MCEIPTIGIDLGTSYSCVAVWQSGKVDIIPNEQGNFSTPSFVAFTDLGRLVGDSAKSQAARNSTNTVYELKRIIGRRFDDPNIQENLHRWPFVVVKDGIKPRIVVQQDTEKKSFFPEELSAMIISKMKEAAESYLGGKVQDAVITVPAYFNSSQRQATKNAATIAGLNVLRVINEPTAAALVYGLDRNFSTEKNILIYDLGGGTLDVSILRIDKGPSFEVLSTAGNTHLGGGDFDDRLLKYLLKEFKKRHQYDISENENALHRLGIAAEHAKRTLSSATVAHIELDSFNAEQDFCVRISRAKFEELCADLFRSTLVSVEKALRDANLSKYDVHEVILIGGSTRIPKIRSLLRTYFNEKQLNLSVIPDEAVARGAAIQAAILGGVYRPIDDDFLLVDVTPLSLGIETAGGVMTNIIDRNSRIPCQRSKIFTTYSDNQETVTVQVYEGERVMTKYNNLLGKFDLTNIPVSPRGVPQIEVFFSLDANSILNVLAKDNKTGERKEIYILNDPSKLPREEISRMIDDAEKYREEDKLLRKKIESKNELEGYIFCAKHVLAEAGEVVTKEEKSFCIKEFEKTLKWVEVNPLAGKEHFDRKLKELREICIAVIKKLPQSSDLV